MARSAVGVIGGGAWGLGLAAAAARVGKETLLLSRRFRSGPVAGGPDPGGGLPEGVTLARSYAAIGQAARLILLAVPSEVARDVARALGPHVDGAHLVVHGVRGLVLDRRTVDPEEEGLGRAADADGAVLELQTITDVIRGETPVRRLGALGGPALASDLIAGRPSVMVCASRYPEVNAALRDAFSSPTMRLYAMDDLLGLEWASALVGCLAIGVGYARGIGLGPGLLAAVITRAVEEASRLAGEAGGDGRTLLGLAGYGDLLASIAQTERPEVLLGEALARGKTLAQATTDARQRVEAIALTGHVVSWARSRGVRAPIFAALARSILSETTPDALVRELMSGPMG